MEIKQVPTTEITPYEKNAKLHPVEQVEWIANSIREFGFKQPLVLDKDNVIVIGHGRLLAAKKLGMKTVPCVYANDLNEEQIKALRLADNKTNESEWDFSLLESELSDIDLNMSWFGFDDQNNIELQDESGEINEITLRPYIKVHYLISIDIKDNPKIIDDIEKIKKMEGVEVESTLN